MGVSKWSLSFWVHDNYSHSWKNLNANTTQTYIPFWFINTQSYTADGKEANMLTVPDSMRGRL